MNGNDQINGTCPAWAIRVLVPGGSWWVTDYGSVTTWTHRKLFTERFRAELALLESRKRGRRCRLVKVARRSSCNCEEADQGWHKTHCPKAGPSSGDNR